MLDIIKQQPGCSIHDVCAHFRVSRIAVMKNLRVLERAKLIHSEKKGRVRSLLVNTVPIQMIHDRWTTEFSAYWASRVARIKYKVETKDKPHGRN
ncbi:MAG: helix-turn-helix transcriptional regulator [Planctomycetota bacterium]